MVYDNAGLKLPSSGDIKEMVKSYTNNTRTILVPILVNYAPIMLLAKRNYYLCVVCNEGEVSLGFSTEITSRGLVTQEIPYSSLGAYVMQNSFIYKTNDEKALGVTDNCEVHSIELITSLGLQTVGALSIVTNEFYSIKEYLSTKSDNSQEFDGVLGYALDMQSRMDAFARQFTGRRMDDSLPKYAELRYINNVIPTNIDITGKCSYINTLVRATGLKDTTVSLDDIPMCIEDDCNVKVMVPNFEDISMLPSNLRRNGDYNITALGYIRSDFGPGSISGIPYYTPTANSYVLALMCNDKMFRDNYKNKVNVVYNNKYHVVDIPNIGAVLEKSPTGNITFASYLAGIVFNAKKG